MIINSYSYAVTGGGGGPDVTPDAVGAFYDASYNLIERTAANAHFQINGIDTTITLKGSYTAGPFYGLTMYYAVVNSLGSWPTDDLSIAGTLLENNDTFTVSNGQYVILGCSETVADAGAEMAILNVSDSNTLITNINAYTYF